MPNELIPMTTAGSDSGGKGSVSCCTRMLRPTQSKALSGVVTPAVGRKTRRFIICMTCCTHASARARVCVCGEREVVRRMSTLVKCIDWPSANHSMDRSFHRSRPSHRPTLMRLNMPAATSAWPMLDLTEAMRSGLEASSCESPNTSPMACACVLWHVGQFGALALESFRRQPRRMHTRAVTQRTSTSMMSPTAVPVAWHSM